eukprot:TRINITY_DN8584_c0_g1_i2.p2 TRINITY_DN8584_c0_g1~~TRINITY_DN8584_c0_g1_i2.p2  ORF type:complete len:166 (-),score=61.08 TRINITY_DN8584_c0_g1_i2:286-783(-)
MFFFFLMIRRPPRSTLSSSSAASDVYKRQMMACVSELSMYQASSMKLGQEKEEMSDLLEGAKERLDSGEVPLEGLEEEWARMQFRQLRQEEEREMREAARGMAVVTATTTTAHVTKTTAEPRPNAYIPDQIGIPKPYGLAAPFKPQEAGASMRHIRKPIPKEIEI